MSRVSSQPRDEDHTNRHGSASIDQPGCSIQRNFQVMPELPEQILTFGTMRSWRCFRGPARNDLAHDSPKGSGPARSGVDHQTARDRVGRCQFTDRPLLASIQRPIW
jgi:hypothetical protein